MIECLPNLVFIFFSGFLAIQCFEAGNNALGWLNLFASALNFASLLIKIF
jgi:hypothetical protein